LEDNVNKVHGNNAGRGASYLGEIDGRTTVTTLPMQQQNQQGKFPRLGTTILFSVSVLTFRVRTDPFHMCVRGCWETRKYSAKSSLQLQVGYSRWAI
jgi:hypothetical protein